MSDNGYQKELRRIREEVNIDLRIAIEIYRRNNLLEMSTDSSPGLSAFYLGKVTALQHVQQIIDEPKDTTS